MKVYKVFLAYDIMSDNSCYGSAWAGDGQYDLKVFDSEAKAQDFISKYREVFKQAEKETRKQIFPRLPNQQKLHDDFGIDLNSICDGMEDVKLNYKVMKVE